MRLGAAALGPDAKGTRVMVSLRTPCGPPRGAGGGEDRKPCTQRRQTLRSRQFHSPVGQGAVLGRPCPAVRGDFVSSCRGRESVCMFRREQRTVSQKPGGRIYARGHGRSLVIAYFKVTDWPTQAVSVTHHRAGRGQGRWLARGRVGRGTHWGTLNQIVAVWKVQAIDARVSRVRRRSQMAFWKHLSVSAPAWGQLS